jgi:hypothetical protein
MGDFFEAVSLKNAEKPKRWKTEMGSFQRFVSAPR